MPVLRSRCRGYVCHRQRPHLVQLPRGSLRRERDGKRPSLSLLPSTPVGAWWNRPGCLSLIGEALRDAGAVAAVPRADGAAAGSLADACRLSLSGVGAGDGLQGRLRRQVGAGWDRSDSAGRSSTSVAALPSRRRSSASCAGAGTFPPPVTSRALAPGPWGRGRESGQSHGGQCCSQSSPAARLKSASPKPNV